MGMEGRRTTCACATEDACQCTHSDPALPQSDEEANLERALLSRTKELSAWWRTQNETTRLTPWSGPGLKETATLLNGTMELAQWHGHWHGHGGPGWGGPGFGCHHGGGCGCVFVLGCFCGHHGGCHR